MRERPIRIDLQRARGAVQMQGRPQVVPLDEELVAQPVARDLQVQHRLLIMVLRPYVPALLVQLRRPLLALAHPIEPLVRVHIHRYAALRADRVEEHVEEYRVFARPPRRLDILRLGRHHRRVGHRALRDADRAAWAHPQRPRGLGNRAREDAELVVGRRVRVGAQRVDDRAGLAEHQRALDGLRIGGAAKLEFETGRMRVLRAVNLVQLAVLTRLRDCQVDGHDRSLARLGTGSFGRDRSHQSFVLFKGYIVHFCDGRARVGRRVHAIAGHLPLKGETAVSAPVRRGRYAARSSSFAF